MGGGAKQAGEKDDPETLPFSLRWPQPNGNFGSVTSDCVWLRGTVENVAVGLPGESDPTTQTDGTS